MKIISIESSNDEKAHKILQITCDSYIIETGVFDDGDDVHICISSQIGCPIGCKMCYNGLKETYQRNLSDKEIIEQVVNVVEKLKLETSYKHIWFSFMGVGEPLLNTNNVINAIHYLDNKYSACRFALATTVPKISEIYKLTEEMNKVSNFKLTISLHSAIDEKRKILIPCHKSLEYLREAMEYFKTNSKHRYEWNYVLLKNFNDTNYDYECLLKFLISNDRIKISSYNSIDLGNFEKSSIERYNLLHHLLDENNIYNSKFDSVGDSINVGCGQMASKKMEKIRRK